MGPFVISSNCREDKEPIRASPGRSILYLGCATLQHETVHLYCMMNGIHDTKCGVTMSQQNLRR